MKKKCLHVFSTFVVGGPQVRFAHMVNNLPREIEHQVIAMDGQYIAKEKLSDDANVSFPEFSYSKNNNLINQVKTFYKALKQLKPDVLVTYNWGAIEWAIVALFCPKLTHIHFEEGFGPDEQVTQHNRRIWMRRLILRWKAKVIVPSNTLMQIATNIWKLPIKRINYLANGIEIPTSINRAEPTGPIVIGTLARLSKEKNIEKMIKALSKIDEPFLLKIGGSGDQEQSLKEFVTQNNMTECVQFCGQQDNPHLFMQQIDLFCLSSDTEQMPLSVLEAMANKLVVVSTDVGDIKHMVSPENSRYVDGLSSEQLLTNLRQAFNNRDSWKAISLANYEKVQREYSVDSMNRQFLELI